MLYAAIRLLLFGSVGGVRSPWAMTSGSSKSGGCISFVIHSMKSLRRLSVEVGDGDGDGDGVRSSTTAMGWLPRPVLG